MVGIWNAHDVSKSVIQSFSGLVCLEHAMCVGADYLIYIYIMLSNVFFFEYHGYYMTLFVSAVSNNKNLAKYQWGGGW